jgi:hypothetical protein
VAPAAVLGAFAVAWVRTRTQLPGALAPAAVLGAFAVAWVRTRTQLAGALALLLYEALAAVGRAAYDRNMAWPATWRTFGR